MRSSLRAFRNFKLVAVLAAALLVLVLAPVAWGNGSLSGTDEVVRAMATDDAGNVYVGGRTLDGLDGFAFIKKYDPNGAEVWTHRFETPETWVTALHVQGTDVWAAGVVEGVALPGNTSAGLKDAFVARLKEEPQTVTGAKLLNLRPVWFKQSGGVANDEARAVAVDSKGRVWVAGFRDLKDSKGSKAFIYGYDEPLGAAPRLLVSDEFVPGTKAEGAAFALAVRPAPSADVALTDPDLHIYVAGKGSLSLAEGQSAFVRKYKMAPQGSNLALLGEDVFLPSTDKSTAKSTATAFALGVDGSEVYVAGEMVPDGSNPAPDAFVRKYDFSGKPSALWTDVFQVTAPDGSNKSTKATVFAMALKPFTFVTNNVETTKTFVYVAGAATYEANGVANDGAFVRMYPETDAKSNSVPTRLFDERFPVEAQATAKAFGVAVHTTTVTDSKGESQKGHRVYAAGFTGVPDKDTDPYVRTFEVIPPLTATAATPELRWTRQFESQTPVTETVSAKFLDGKMDATLNPVALGVDVTITATVKTDAKVLRSAWYGVNGGEYVKLSGSTPEYGKPATTTNGEYTVTGTTAFKEPGVHKVCVHGERYTTNEVVAEADLSKPNVYTVSGKQRCVTLVSYDPTQGHVTGVGWIDSPAGAYPANAKLTGKASFGFVSEIKNGATTPTGNTEFQFRAAELNFHSTTYEKLVVAGARAQFNGTGTIKDRQGEYKFTLTVTDGEQLPPTATDYGIDKLRMKITDEKGGVIYDNQIGKDDSVEPTTVAQGEITIHKAK